MFQCLATNATFSPKWQSEIPEITASSKTWEKFSMKLNHLVHLGVHQTNQEHLLQK
jgi:hypothetical protein